MTKLEFLHGHPFKYAGKAERLAKNTLFFDAQVQQMVDETAKEEWPVSNITEKGFLAESTFTGLIPVDFKQCAVCIPAKKN